MRGNHARGANIADMKKMREESEPLPLDKVAEQILEECRMVLPGIQALFGFQLVAVFNEHFQRSVDIAGKRLHLAAIMLIVTAIALIMTPASLQRIAEPRSVSQEYVLLCSRLILAAMVPLALAISLETYLVACSLLDSRGWALAMACFPGLLFVVLWWVMPFWKRTHAWG